jgi:hypothetical protein
MREPGRSATVARLHHAPLAQLAEHPALNRQVRGSSPWRRTHEDRSCGAGPRRSGCRRVSCERADQAAALPTVAARCLPSGQASGRRQVGAARRVRARRGTGTITARGGRLQAQVSLGRHRLRRCRRGSHAGRTRPARRGRTTPRSTPAHLGDQASNILLAVHACTACPRCPVAHWRVSNSPISRYAR